MYEELVKRLRNRANGSYEEKCEGCEFTEDFPPCVHCTIKAFNDAADAIEELSREIDIDNAAMTAMDAAMPRWNSVEEWLPKPGEESLVLASKSGMEVALYEEGFYGEAEWFTTSGKLEGVTHWMPLPEPPMDEHDG